MAGSKSILGVAGEYYVAAELCIRDIYAQLTLGNQKRADLLVFSEETNKLLKVEVKSKQGKSWPNCKGIHEKNSFIVFVDFEDLKDCSRPDFYILSLDDWVKIIKGKKKEYLTRHPGKKVEIDDKNVLVWHDQINKNGTPYKGCGVDTVDVKQYKDKWDKIAEALT